MIPGGYLSCMSTINKASCFGLRRSWMPEGAAELLVEMESMQDALAKDSDEKDSSMLALNMVVEFLRLSDAKKRAPPGNAGEPESKKPRV